jgi:hypothetical protein
MAGHALRLPNLERRGGQAVRPTVYGYISVQHEDEGEITELHNQLTMYAEAEGVALAGVYVDRNITPGRGVRPGLTALLDTVQRRSYRCGEVCARGQRYWWRMWAGGEGRGWM